jgi:hypothetical protein
MPGHSYSADNFVGNLNPDIAYEFTQTHCSDSQTVQISRWSADTLSNDNF